MNLLSQLLRAARLRFCIALASSLLGGLGSALLVAVINETLAASADTRRAWAAAFVLLAVGVPTLRWLSQAKFVELQQFALARLRTLLSAHITRVPFAQVEGEGGTRLLTVLLEDVSTVSDFFTALPRFVMQGAIVAGAFSYLAWLSWQALCCALALVFLGSLIHFWAVRLAGRHFEAARLGEDALYANFLDLTAGAKELCLSRARREHFLRERLDPSVEAVLRHNTRGFLTYVGAGSWGAFMFFAVIGGVIFGLGSVLEFAPSVRAGFALMFLYMMFPLEDLLEAVPDLVRVKVALDRIEERCGGALESSSEHGAARVDRLRSIELIDVEHRYRRDNDEGTFQVGPLSLRLRPGELVFLVGGNGSGKTTLAKLLVGLYQPEAGELRVNGERVASGDAYRQLFSAVFSDFHLFDPGLDEPAVQRDGQARKLLAELALDHKVRVEGGRFSTTALSSGQRKRLALLVACLEDRPVCLFDEWAADQDPTFKEVFYTRILAALRAQGKAVLVVTHDDRYFHVADRCLRLESGRLAEMELEARAPGVVRTPSARRGDDSPGRTLHE